MTTDGKTKIPIRIISNLSALDGFQTDRFVVLHRYAGLEGSAWSGVRLFFWAFRADVIILNNDLTRLFALCLLRYVFPFQSCRLVSLDIVLKKPVGWREKTRVFLKRLLLRKVNLFIHYFKDIAGYETFYGISRSRSVYVPFKVNLPSIPPREEVLQEGEYVATIGRSHRDLDTFVAAMREVTYPGRLIYQNTSLLSEHGTAIDLNDLPPNLRAESDEGGSQSYNQYIRRAKVVVVPIAAGCLSPAGISTYLVAMALGRCVILSEGTASRELISDQAIVVPAGDPSALAHAIRQAWEDDGFRKRIADSGWRYASQLGSEPRLLRDVVNVAGELVGKRTRVSAGQEMLNRPPSPPKSAS